ncbi:MAG: hypothetical protein JSW11_11015 [Candidatus Heimdallarchaeota archaeon]|nr:MAG: hypothetical protein JSW11_11015 [Candidatus Heimdallarchaeota archaeon]
MVLSAGSYSGNQTLIHKKLKEHYLSEVGGTEEALVDIKGKKYRIDVLNQSKTIIYEIQLTNFGSIFSDKIRDLLEFTEMKIIIVHPIVLTQKVTRMNQGKIVGVSHYSKQGNLYSLFEKLVHFKVEFKPQRMEFHVVFTKEHVLKEFTGYYGRSMRRRYKTIQRDLICIEKIMKFQTKSDFIGILPKGLPDAFTNTDLAEKMGIKGKRGRIQRIPGIITYSLCRLGVLNQVGRRGRAHEFSIKAS